MDLDPQARAFLDQLYDEGLLPYPSMTPAEARAARARRPRSALPSRHTVTEYQLSLDDRTLRVVRFDAKPITAEPLPAILFLHAGGWVLGAVESDDRIFRALLGTEVARSEPPRVPTRDPLCAALAELTGVSVFSVDYRLAPEHPFPAALLDTQAALGWLSEEAPRLGIDREAIALFGVSAGGTLAAATCQEHAVHLAAQVLFYPPLDASRKWPSYGEPRERLILDAETMDWFYRHYLPPSQPLDDPRVSPLCAADLSRAPATLLLVASHDPLRDECMEYATALERAGVDVTCRQFPTLMHGFLGGLGCIDAAREALVESARWLSLRLG